jgi:hypothetical protein
MASGEKLMNEFCTAMENPEQVQATMNYLADRDSKPVSYAYTPPAGTPVRESGRWCFLENRKEKTEKRRYAAKFSMNCLIIAQSKDGRSARGK